MSKEFDDQVIEQAEDEYTFDDAVNDVIGDTSTRDMDDSDDDELDNEDSSLEEISDEEDQQNDEAKEETLEDDSLDYRSLYNEQVAKNAALHANMKNQVEERFKSWQGRVEAERKAEETKVKESAQEASIEITKEMEEAFELFPELIPQVQKLIDSNVSKKVSEVEARIQHLITEKVDPIAQRMVETEAQAQERAIRKAHPNIDKDLASGSFRAWVESLEPFQQIGVNQICETGTTDQIISLFDSFEASKSRANTQKSNEPKSTATVDKLKNAMHVKSAPSEVDVTISNKTEDPKKLFEQFSKQLMKEEAIL